MKLKDRRIKNIYPSGQGINGIVDFTAAARDSVQVADAVNIDYQVNSNKVFKIVERDSEVCKHFSTHAASPGSMETITSGETAAIERL